MTISLTLTAEILLGKGSDRHLLTPTPLLWEKNRRKEGPGDLPGPDAIRPGVAVVVGGAGSAMEAGCLDAIHPFVHPTTPL